MTPTDVWRAFHEMGARQSLAWIGIVVIAAGLFTLFEANLLFPEFALGGLAAIGLLAFSIRKHA
jgi:hypothetical protein